MIAYALNLPPDLRPTYKPGDAYYEGKAALDEFTTERYRYRDAAQARITPRRWFQRN